MSLKIVKGPGFPGWIIDLYSHFKRLNLLSDNNRNMMIDLRKYYEQFDFKSLTVFSKCIASYLQKGISSNFRFLS